MTPDQVRKLFIEHNGERPTAQKYFLATESELRSDQMAWDRLEKVWQACAAALQSWIASKFTKLDKPKYKGDPMLDAVLATESPEFRAWVNSLPAEYWARYDLSAARIGWESRGRQLDEPAFAHRLAVMLECALLNRRTAWDDGHALLDEYRKACSQPTEDSPTHMGEPVLPPKPAATVKMLPCKNCGPEHTGYLYSERKWSESFNRARFYLSWAGCRRCFARTAEHTTETVNDNPAREDWNLNFTLPAPPSEGGS